MKRLVITIAGDYSDSVCMQNFCILYTLNKTIKT